MTQHEEWSPTWLRIKCHDLIPRALHAMGGSARTREVYDWIERELDPPRAVLRRRTPSGDYYFENTIRFAREDLAGAGRIDRSIFKVWSLTAQGPGVNPT